MSSLTGLDLSEAPLEVNAFHYPPGGSHGAHPDHRSKIVTHILYFNETWNEEDGGCLLILRSSDTADASAKVSPLSGNSAVVVRSDNSWHAVSRVAGHSPLSRRCVTATFYEKGTENTVWPRRSRRVWQRLRRAMRRAE
jgi:Rps23 Pro-64 3,4-dihydroxylase Tpa1-like proline 4-hydroxylase